jgi:hypothetical protein
MSRLLHFLDNRFTDGSEVVSLTHRLHFNPRKIYFYSFLNRLSQPQGRILVISNKQQVTEDAISPYRNHTMSLARHPSVAYFGSSLRIRTTSKTGSGWFQFYVYQVWRVCSKGDKGRIVTARWSTLVIKLCYSSHTHTHNFLNKVIFLYLFCHLHRK